MWIDEWLASQELVEWERDLVGTLKRSNRIKHRVIPSALEAARNQVACLEVRARVECTVLQNVPRNLRPTGDSVQPSWTYNSPSFHLHRLVWTRRAKSTTTHSLYAH